MPMVSRSLILCAAFTLFSCEERIVAAQPETAIATGSCASGAAGPYDVVRVSDGDTISVRIPGKKPVLVRMIGVDAPEISGPYRNEEAHGVEARAFARALLDRRVVYLESDPQQDTYDRYGRMLAYVHRADDCLHVNAEMIRQGHAESYRKFRFRHRSLFLRYEQEARINRRGLWSEGGSRAREPSN